MAGRAIAGGIERTTPYLKETIVADAHDVRATVDDDHCHLDGTASTDDDGPDKCEDGCFRVNDGARANGDIAGSTS